MRLFAGSASAQEERTIRWGHLNNTDHPVSFGVKKFAEILLAKSGGKMQVREFAASQLGNELQQQSALRGGTQEMLSASTTSLATVVPEFGVLDFPFIVSKIFWDKLSPTEQKMMREAYEESRGYQKEQTRLQTEKALSELQAKGMQYNAIAPEELERMRKAVQPVVSKIAGELRPDKVKLFNDELERVHKEFK